MKQNLSRALGALAVAAGLGASATGASAQKALVYCPVGIDATGCASAAAALGGSFPDGVDRGYDGTGGTLDLKTADLADYSLVVVPSLSDNPAKAPYALLRSTEVAPRLAELLTGRVSVWSGTPDQGRGSRDAKNVLLRNLAAHAAGSPGAPGLLVLQDASVAISDRYGWLAGISGRSISARPGARVFGFARGLSAAGSRVLENGGSPLAFGNMASFGLVIPDGSDWTADVEGADAAVAYGGRVRSHGAASVTGALADRLRAAWARMFAAYNVVLATSPGASGGSAKPALTLSVQPDSLVALVAGAATANVRANLSTMGNCNNANLSGVRVNFSIAPSLSQNNTALSSGEATWSSVNLSALTLGTSYPVTATSTASGNCATNTASGAIRVKKGTALLGLSATGGGVGASTTLQARLVDRSPSPGNTGIQGMTVSFTIGASTFTGSTVGNGTATAAGTLPAAPGTYKVYVRFAGTESPAFYMAALDSTTVTVSSAAATGIVVSAASGDFGGTAGLSATLTSGGSPVVGRTVGFTLNGTAVCGGATGVACPTTDASGVASLGGVSLGGIGAGAYAAGVAASFAGDGGYVASSATGALTVNKAGQAALTLSGVPASAAFNSSFTVTAGGGSGTAPLAITTSGVCSAAGNLVTMTGGTGSCTVKVNRAGDANYNAAAEVAASATASKVSQSALTLSGVPASAPFNSTFAVTPGGGSGTASLVVTTSGVCSIAGNDVTMTGGTGSCTVRVNRAGDDNYDAAPEVTAAATAAKLGQAALSLSGVPATAAYNSTFTVMAGGGSSSAALVVTTAGVCSVSGSSVTVTSGTGTCTVKLNRAGDGNYDDAGEVSASATASKVSQPALSLSGVPATAPFNSTFTVTPGGGSGTAALLVTTAGVCSASGNSVTMTSGTGTCTVKVNRAGDGNYDDAAEITASAAATRLGQAALTLSGVPASAPFNSSFTVAPGGGSGSAPLVVTTAGVCSASGNSVTMTSGTGTCTVRVNRAGDDDYEAAAEVTATAAAAKLGQAALSLTGVPSSAGYNFSFAVTAGGGSGSAALVVTTAGVCSISGNSVIMTSGTGTCTVKVNRAGDDNYDAADEVSAAAAAARIAQSALSVTSPTAGTFGLKYTPTAAGGSGTGALTFAAGASTACAIVASGPDAGRVEITRGTGTCELTASKAADANYEAASSPALPVALSKAAQTVTFAQPASPQTFGATFTVNPSASSGLTVAIAAAGGCTVAPASPGYTVSMTSGTTACVLTAAQTGNDDYLAATAVAGSALERTVSAARAPATLAFALALPAKTYGDPGFSVAGSAAAGASGIVVAFSGTTPSVCTVSPAGQVQLLKSGSCTVRAAQAADANYAAGQIDQTFAVGKRALGVEYTGDNYAATGGPTIGTATIRLSATVQRVAGGTLGDLGLARVRFTLTKQGGGSQTVFAMADAAGNAMATANLAADNDNQWQVQTTLDPDNAYWSGDFDTDALTVVTGSTEKRTTGGGWIADSRSANGKANFGFSVAYQKNGNPRGNLTYVYRGTDGYDYVVKSNSWQGGALTFDNRDASLAAFSGRATVQRIDRATGVADPAWPAGNYTFTVDGTDGDLKSPKAGDSFAITIMDGDGRIWRQVGTRAAPVQLGGGNVAVQSR